MTTHDRLNRKFHDTARTAVAIIRARWAGDDLGAAQVLAHLDADELRDFAWSISGLLEAALVLPANTNPDNFLDALLRGIDNSETDQENKQ